MSVFSDLQRQHEALLAKQQLLEEDVSQQAEDYIRLSEVEAAKIWNVQEREHLRSNLRYWASYVYEKTGSFPSFDLRPGPTIPTIVRYRALFSALAGVFVLILTGFVIALFIRTSADRSIALALSSMKLTQVAGEITQTAIALLVPPTLTPSKTLTSTPVPTLTAIFYTPSPTATTPTPQVTQSLGILAQIEYPVNGQDILPEVVIEGTYSNLQSGWSVHVLLQPLSVGGKIFPQKNYYLVPSMLTSGKWSIDARFGQGGELEKADTYIVKLAIALNDSGRKIFADALESGFDLISTENIIELPQVIVVQRKAYIQVDTVRLVYSLYFEVNHSRDLVSTLPDGTDLIRITYTSEFSELDPSLSPDGKKIAYVARRRGSTDNMLYALEIIDANGQNRATLIGEEAGIVYENPAWSTDGKYLAYTVNRPKEGQVPWVIQIFNLEQNQIVEEISEKYDVRYFCWFPNSHSLIYGSRILETGTSGFRLFDLDNPANNRVYYDTAEIDELQPAISSDGQKLAFVGGRPTSGNISKRHLYYVDMNTKEAVQVTKDDFPDSHPVWAPGNQIVYFERVIEKGFIWWVGIGSGMKPQMISEGLHPSIGYMSTFFPIAP